MFILNIHVPSTIKISKVSFKKVRGTSVTPVTIKLVCVKVIHVRMWKLLILTSLIVEPKVQLCLSVQM